jgi:type III pantothenate kinase
LKKTIIIDIGNSFVKVKYLDDIHCIYADELVTDNIKNTIDITDIDVAIISSVDIETENRIIDFLIENNINTYMVNDLLQKQDIIDFSKIKEMGSDRKLGLIGAVKLYTAPIITIDCGTAITINILSKDNICLGGAIMCGVGTHTKALEHFTSCLPKIKINFKSFDRIDNTEDAINAGIISAVRGGIVDFVWNAIYKQHLQHTSIIFTGGYSNHIFKLCKNRLQKINSVNQKIEFIGAINNLVIDGIEKLFEMDKTIRK